MAHSRYGSDWYDHDLVFQRTSSSETILIDTSENWA